MLRFVVGTSLGGNVVIGTLLMELILPEQRVFLRTIVNWVNIIELILYSIFKGYARLIMTLIAMAVGHWRYASFLSALVISPALIVVYFVLPESPTYLHKKNRLEDMERSERTIARIGHIRYVPSMIVCVYEERYFVAHHDNEPIANVGLLRSLFIDWHVSIRTLALWTIFFNTGISSYANDLNSPTLVGDFFENQIMFSLLIGVSKIVCSMFVM